MQVIIELDNVPEWQIGKEAIIYFPDTMVKHAICKKAPGIVSQEPEGGGHMWWTVCSECHGIVDTVYKFCKHCGGRFASGRYKFE